jgi:hypothetical protein
VERHRERASFFHHRSCPGRKHQEWALDCT